jgi:hypothetical protein
MRTALSAPDWVWAAQQHRYVTDELAAAIAAFPAQKIRRQK